MPDAEIIILPVIRVFGPSGDEVPVGAVLAPVVDINAVRYQRERKATERREMRSLLDETGGGE